MGSMKTNLNICTTVKVETAHVLHNFSKYHNNTINSIRLKNGALSG